MEPRRSDYKHIGSFPQDPVRKRRVCVVGAGPAGLCAAKHSQQHGMAVTVFEQSGDIGGTWQYTDCTDRDEHGAPVHTSMIDLPEEILIYPDFPHKGTDEICISSREVLEYLKNYADTFELRTVCKFHNRVRKVSKTDYYWLVTVMELASSIEVNYTFDIIFICKGVNKIPYIPEVEDSALFQGLSLHSREYQTPEPFRGKTVLIIGGEPSALDITNSISMWAVKVFLSHHSEISNMNNLQLPGNMVIKPNVQRFSSLAVEFTDGTMENVDTVIYCTGFEYNYSFLDVSSGMIEENNSVNPLYKHFINAIHPTMCILGNIGPTMQLPTFDMQVKFFLKSIATSSLPEKEIMLAEVNERAKKKISNRTKEKIFRATPEELFEYFQHLSSMANI